MATKRRTNRKPTDDLSVLHRLMVNDPVHQRILIDSLPCGIKTVHWALSDDTPYQINAPRALMVCHWKGMVRAFQLAEVRRGD